MDNQKEAYKVEAYELLGELESSLLELEQNPTDPDLIDRVFRAMHTIKGSGAMFGFDAIAEFTHDVETVFDRVRDGKIAVSTELVNLSLQARDHIKSMLDNDDDPDAIKQEEADVLLESFRSFIIPTETSGESVGPEADECVDGSTQSDEGEDKIFRIRFSPHQTLFQNGTNPISLLNELIEMGDSRVIAHTDEIPEPEYFDPELCYLEWDIILKTKQSLESIQDVFIFVEDACDLEIEIINTLSELSENPDYKQLGKILMDRGDIAPQDLESALGKQKRLGEILIEEQLVPSNKVQSALSEQEFVRTVGERKEAPKSASSLRVAAEKLDILVNLVGELVTVQARLSQKANHDNDPELRSITEVVERLTAELRDNTLSIRMLPIDVTFTKLRRLVRDLSRELGKQITLKTEGGDTELDKTVIEQLNDPLVHILRNSIDHGIELPDRRKEAGKPEHGTIILKAEHSGANVLIHIKDDGAGIDPEKVRRKAIEKGWINEEYEKSDKECLQMIFQPGFSTAGTVSNVSGRGVGMDVVKRSIEGLRGTVEVNSEVGHGTIITLKLPLTLAIIDGLLVEIDANKYVLPLATIEECVELTREQLEKTHGRNILHIREQIVPFIPLRKHFCIAGESPNIEQVVVNEVDGQRIGIVVDRVIGEHQIVIKTMNVLYKEVQEISGATILGDGTVALILDVQKLVSEMEETDLAA